MKLNYSDWMKKVNEAIGRACGLCAEDLPDCSYSDWYEDGMSPPAAAKHALRNAGE